ncbi:GGDEF domain-containing protein [Thalassotalea ganghwensis]
MKDKTIESIIEITQNTDTDAFSVSILLSLTELISDSEVVLFDCQSHQFGEITLVTNSSRLVGNTINHIELTSHSVDIVKTHLLDNANYIGDIFVMKLDENYHLIIPILVNRSLMYAFNIVSQKAIHSELPEISAIIKVCQNFYSILSVSEQDSLTGLLNRRTYDQKLNVLITRQVRNQQQDLLNPSRENFRQTKQNVRPWLAIVDIDFFKRVNDTFGHVYGDEVLLTLSQLMKSSFRRNDLLFRFGGEEFVIVFEPMKQHQAFQLLEAFRVKVEAYQFPMVKHVTISCGLTEVVESTHPSTIFERADKALYYAKGNGRNQVQCYEELLDDGILVVNDKVEGDIELF